MDRTIEFSRLVRALASLLACVVLASPCLGGDGKTAAEMGSDPHTGEKRLREMFGTADLGPLRLRAAIVGPQELRKERARLEAIRKAGRFTVEAAASTWTSLGPTYLNVDGGSGTSPGVNSGMTSDVKVHPTDPKTIFVGTGGGGVWRTTDGGRSWVPLTDDLGQLPIGAVAIAPSRPHRIYAGIGCGDWSSDLASAPGLGVIISDDSGATWRFSKAGTGPGTAFFALDVDPRNPDVVLAASDTGLWRSVDGGGAWTRVIAVPAQSLSRCSSSPDVIFAGTWDPGGTAAGSVWRSGNGGVAWTEKADGLPGTSTPFTSTARGRAEVAVAPTDPNRVYVLLAASDGWVLDLAVSDDGASSWTPTNIVRAAPYLLTQGWAMIALAVDPANRDTVYAGGFDTWKSVDAGRSWKQLSTGEGLAGPLPYVHFDQHGFAFGPDESAYFATDGGLFRTVDGGKSFTSLNEGLVTMQLNTFCQSQTDPNLVLSGAQDAGVQMKLGGSTGWRMVPFMGDGYGCLVHPSDPDVLHASVHLQRILRSDDGGGTWKEAMAGIKIPYPDWPRFGTLLRRHPTKPATLYTSSAKQLWVTTDNADNWQTKAPSVPKEPNFIMDFHVFPTDGSRIVLVDESPGQVYETLDEGATFTRLGTVPVDHVFSLKYDRRSVRTIWAASAKETAGVERVWRTTDGGATWSAVSGVGQPGGLPDLPVEAIEQDPWDPDVWWAGTYIGLYRSPDNGKSWGRHGFGLPNTIVTAIGFFLPDRKVRIATMGRGIWETSAQAGPSFAAEILFPTVDAKIQAGATVSLVGGASGAEPAGLTFSWDFGDGTAAGSGPQVRHSFNTPGTYPVVLTVSGGGGSTLARRTVQVVPNGGGFGPGGQAALSSGRVGVAVTFRDIYNGIVVAATPLKQADELAFFYFTDPLNPEVFVKVLDFGSSQPFLCFYGGLTNYEYTVTFTVLATGKSVSFVTPANSYRGGIDNTSLPWIVPAGAFAGPSVTALRGVPNTADPQELLLQGDKVGVKVAWRNQYDGSSGTASPIPQQDAYGYFYFSAPTNAELFVKVLDFGPAQPYLLFWAGLTNFEYTLTFRNVSTGKSWSYRKPAGTYDGGANISDLPR